MYDPKTGKEYKANTYDDHIRMKKMGYVHEKPKMKEEGELNEILPFIAGIAGRMLAKAVIAKAAKRAQQKRAESKKMKKVKEKRAISFTNFRKSNDWDEITEKTEYDGISIELNNPTKKE